ncbi:hypothetical protein FACS1894103_2020 [Campylobacterota bacterium]|nr:hypothetical protein FACS1894103_2020 [Campylobacterota bacterium]
MIELTMADQSVDEVAESSSDSDGGGGDDSGDSGDQNDQESSDSGDLMDYLENGSEGAGINVEASFDSSNANQVIDYLESDKGAGESRELFDKDGNKISAKEAAEIVGTDGYRAQIYAPENQNISKEQIHELVDKMANYEIDRVGAENMSIVYAVHTRADGTHAHAHVVYHSPNRAEVSKVGNFESKQALAEHIEARATIENSVQQLSNAEVARNEARQESLQNGQASGTEKADAAIERSMAKENSPNCGRVSMAQIDKSLSMSVDKGRMTAKGAREFHNRVEGRLNAMEKQGIGQWTNADHSHFQMDRAQWTQYQEIKAAEKAEIKAEKTAEAVQKGSETAREVVAQVEYKAEIADKAWSNAKAQRTAQERTQQQREQRDQRQEQQQQGGGDGGGGSQQQSAGADGGGGNPLKDIEREMEKMRREVDKQLEKDARERVNSHSQSY